MSLQLASARMSFAHYLRALEAAGLGSSALWFRTERLVWRMIFVESRDVRRV